MVGTYEIMQGERPVGRVQVRKQGLYYHFSCRCCLTGEVMHRLVVSNGAGREDLGVCVPMDGKFGVEKKVPCKRLGEGTPDFQLVPKHEPMEGRFVPISAEEPFAYMTRLKDAFLDNRSGRLGIVIRE